MRTLAIVLLALTACSETTKVADKIAAQRGGKVTIGGGKFVNVELNARDQAACDADQRWVRDNIKSPPDCVRVKCTLPSGEDSIVSYDGYWNGLQGGGYFPKCAK
jgi:hypothetical protein